MSLNGDISDEAVEINQFHQIECNEDTNMVGKICFQYVLREKIKLLVKGFSFSLSFDDCNYICDRTLCLGFCSIETTGDTNRIKTWTAHDHPPHQYLLGAQGELFLSNRNASKLSVAGFTFDHEREEKYWSCSKRRSQKCKGRCTTVQMGTFKYVVAWADHSHCPDAADLPVMQMKNRLKK
jgi:hypothetical protein